MPSRESHVAYQSELWCTSDGPHPCTLSTNPSCVRECSEQNASSWMQFMLHSNLQSWSFWHPRTVVTKERTSSHLYFLLQRTLHKIGRWVMGRGKGDRRRKRREERRPASHILCQTKSTRYWWLCNLEVAGFLGLQEATRLLLFSFCSRTEQRSFYFLKSQLKLWDIAWHNLFENPKQPPPRRASWRQFVG